MLLLALGLRVGAQELRSGVSQARGIEAGTAAAPESRRPLRPGSSAIARARRFTAGRRTLPSGASAARALANARVESLALRPSVSAAHPARPRTPGASTGLVTGLGAAWTAAGPVAIHSLAYGDIAGRVTSLALDPADATGNTLFVGTTGGGVWRSTNAAGPAAQVSFAPMTDDLAVFSPSAGSSAKASLSIGALAALPGGVLLAGTGDPNDSADSYYGTGILRSTDAGLTWSLTSVTHDGVAGNHSFFGLGFAGFAYSTAHPSLVVAAVSQSAEGLLVNAPNSSSVMGLYYSTDAGASWQMSTLMDGAQVLQAPTSVAGVLGNAATAVVWNPVRQSFLAAVRYHGYYQSPDGITWTRLSSQPGAGLSLSACPTTSVPNAACPIFRGALAVNPISGDTFALTTDLSDQDRGLFRDVCGATGSACATANPTFAQQLPSAPLEVGSGSSVIPQSDYNLALAALPVAVGTSSADTLLFVGTADLFRCSVAAGCMLRNTTNTANGCGSPAQMAPAQHAIVSGGPALNPLLFFGNDGGLWRSTDTVNHQASPCSPDDAAHFQNLNATLGSLAEVVSFAQDPVDSTVLLAGLGGSGTVSTSSSSNTSWQQISAAEGGSVAIDRTNPALWYLSTRAGISIAACDNGSACTAADVLAAPTIGPAQVSSDIALLDAPWLLDPALPANLLAGTCRVWRGPAAGPTLWSGANALSDLLAGPQGAACAANNALLSALGAGGPSLRGTATSGSSVVYAGVAGVQAGGGTSVGGHVFVNTAANTATPTTVWTDVAAAANVANDVGNTGHFNPGGFSVSSVTADPHDSTGRTVYVTVEGFSGNGVSIPHVYRSTDAGAHWTVVSANLPNAPASALAVDPNNANTVYVALDTGVYVTTAITTCPAQNCWDLLGTGLPNAPVTTLAAAAAMPTGDGRLGMLRAGTYGRGLWQIPLLTATTIERPAISLTPSALTFPSTAVGSSSVTEAVVVSNTGSAPLVVSSLAITSQNAPVGVQGAVTDFAVASAKADTCTGSTVAVGATCSFAVVFNPSAPGARSSTLTLYANVTGGQATLALSGTATAAPAVSFTPSSLSFPLTTLAATSAAQNVVLANTGGATVSVSSIYLTGADFQIVFNSCGASLAPSTSCTISVVFAPVTSGNRSGTVAAVDALGTQTVTLAGTAQTPATDALSSTALSFATTQVGSPSATQQLVLTNAGDVPLTLIATSVSSPDFAATNSCGNSLAGHSACSVVVSFIPHTVGTVSATLAVADEFRTQTVALSGTGIAPAGVSLLPAGTIGFPVTGVGQSSAAQMLTLTNNGGLPLILSSITLTGDFSLATGSTCGASVAPAQACMLAVIFTPGSTGARTGSVTVVDNTARSPQTVAFTGTGIDFTFALNSGSTSQTVASGSSAVFPLLLSSATGLPGSATLTCTGVPTYAVCNLSANTAPLGGSTVITATIATGIASATATARPEPGSGAPHTGSSIALAAALLPLGMLLLRRRNGVPPLMGLLLAVATVLPLLGLVGCSTTPRTIPGSGTGVSGSTTTTPSGTYAVVVTASSAGLARNVTLSVTVQ